MTKPLEAVVFDLVVVIVVILVIRWAVLAVMNYLFGERTIIL